MQSYSIPLWKEAPFVRYIAPFIAGILIQRSFPALPQLLIAGLALCWLTLLGFNLSALRIRHSSYQLAGASIFILLFLLGALIALLHNIQNSSRWVAYHLNEARAFVAVIEEPPLEKPKSFKAVARLSLLVTRDGVKPVSGNIILYFPKKGNTTTSLLRYGDRILMKNDLQPIADFKNATGFSYRNYCALQNIHHQQFLKKDGFICLDGNEGSFLMQQLIALRESIIHILKTYIKGSREAGLAEALLIGYKSELDKNLVQSYSNTGVVHIIAISGLHVGLIYAVLYGLMSPLSRYRPVKKMRPLLLLAGLWTFSLVAGGSASVIRSAVMFSFMVIGNSLGRRSRVYNSLAASAFLLLCYNPFWLWDPGFQLSYLAVLSIILFRKRLYDLLYVQHPLLDMLWKMTAVTISAQILTTPLCLYYFHQFPNLFLFANCLAVPLSSLILSGELLLCLASLLPPVAIVLGSWLEQLIRLLNEFIIHLGKIPFAVTQGLEISAGQTLVLYIIIVMLTIWKK